MNKGQFIKAYAEKAGISQKDADACYEAFVGTVVDALKAGEKIALVGFGSFELKSKAARVGINPATKAKINIAASKAPAFKVGKSFKDIFNA